MPRGAKGRESTNGYQRHPHPSGTVPSVPYLLRAGDTDSSSACFPSHEGAQEEIPLLTPSTTEVSGAITHHVYCQDLQETIKLKKKLEKGNRMGTLVSLLIARAAHEARHSCWRISLRIGLTFGTRHVLLVLCPSGSAQLPSAARSPWDKRLSEVQNYKFMLDLSDLLLMSTNMLEPLSGPSRTVSELIQSLV